MRQDLITVLKKLAKRVRSGSLKLDGIIIETTGLADPAPVAQTFFVDDDVQKFARLDGIVTLVDAKHIEQHLDAVKPEGAENEAVEQVAFADRMLLNKTDLVSEADLVRVEARLRAINGIAPIKRCSRAAVSVDSVLDIRGFDLKRVVQMDPGFLDTDAEHEHDSTVTSLSVLHPGEVHLEAVQEWIQMLLRDHGADIYRMKGVLAIAHAKEKFVYQAVHMIFSGEFVDSWADGEARASKFVFIGKNLDHAMLRAGFEACACTPESVAKRLKTLRFAKGDAVECRTGKNKWTKGKVVQLMYREDFMQPGEVAPYQVQLASGDLIYAPADVDDLIRRA